MKFSDHRTVSELRSESSRFREQRGHDNDLFICLILKGIFCLLYFCSSLGGLSLLSSLFLLFLFLTSFFFLVGLRDTTLLMMMIVDFVFYYILFSLKFQLLKFLTRSCKLRYFHIDTYNIMIIIYHYFKPDHRCFTSVLDRSTFLILHSYLLKTF